MKFLILGTLLAIISNSYANTALVEGSYECRGTYYGEKLNDSLDIARKDGYLIIESEMMNLAISKDCKVENIPDLTAQCFQDSIKLPKSHEIDGMKIHDVLSFTQVGKKIILKNDQFYEEKSGKRKKVVGASMTCRLKK